jgi:hypothetical protein
MMEELTKFEKGIVTRPRRHFYDRFAKDLKQWNLRHIDHMHYTLPLYTPLADGFRFPSTYVGQYGVYEALKHLLSTDP